MCDRLVRSWWTPDLIRDGTVYESDAVAVLLSEATMDESTREPRREGGALPTGLSTQDPRREGGKDGVRDGLRAATADMTLTAEAEYVHFVHDEESASRLQECQLKKGS